MEFRMLGSLQVLDDERQIPLGGARQREALATLLLQRGEVVSVDRVVDELWGQRPPDAAIKTVQVWVANGGDGTLARIDSGTRQVTKTIEVGSSPSALAVADGSVWTTALASPETHRGGTLRLKWPKYAPIAACRCVDPIAYANFQSWWLAAFAYRWPRRLSDGWRSWGCEARGKPCLRGPRAERRRQDLRLRAATGRPLLG